MRTLRTVCLAFGFALVLAPSRAEEKRDYDEEAIKLLESLANIMDKDKDNCPAMAKDINAYVDTNARLIEELKKRDKTQTPAERDAWLKKYRDRLEAAVKKMMAGGVKCQNDKAVQAAVSRMH